MDLTRLSLVEALEGLRARRFSSVELTKAVLGEIERREKDVHAFITLTADDALQQATKADQARAEGTDGALLGVPLALKDIFCTRGIRTTCGSRILETFIPPYDATVTRRLREAGAVILGKNNMDEFAMGSSTERSAFGPTRNPLRLDLVPGGSSGGSAAAVAARFCFGSIGTDTGGSIRQPAAFCGVVGLKPTYGRISRYGMVAFASSLDQAGPLTRTVRDAAALLTTLAGHDPLDSTSSPLPPEDFAGRLRPTLKGIRLGRPKEYFMAGLDPEVRSVFDRALARLEAQGARVVDVTLPHTEHAVATYYIVAPAEASSNLSRYDGVKYGLRAPGANRLIEMNVKSRSMGFGDEVKRRIMIGTYALSSGYYDAYYLKALKVRRLIKQDFDRAFEQADVVVSPTTPTPPFRLGEKMDDPIQMYLADVYTIPCNLAGLCGISIPCGKTAGGLPVGLQLQAKPLDEQTLLNVAQGAEESFG